MRELEGESTYGLGKVAAGGRAGVPPTVAVRGSHERGAPVHTVRQSHQRATPLCVNLKRVR